MKAENTGNSWEERRWEIMPIFRFGLGGLLCEIKEKQRRHERQRRVVCFFYTGKSSH